MSALLAEAERFYAVARSLRRQIEELTAMAEFLERSADRMCEENIRQTGAVAKTTAPEQKVDER